MSNPHLVPLDMNGNEILNAVFQNLATSPQTAVEGQYYWDTVKKALMIRTGDSWQSAGGSYVLPAATASTLGGIKKGSGLEITADGTLSLNETTVRGLAEETVDSMLALSGDDTPASKGYVDDGLSYKQDVLTSGTDIKTINGDSILSAGDLELATKAELGNYLELAGGTMTGDIAMGGNAITGLGDPTNNGDAATKGYVDANVVGALKPSGSVTFANLPALGASVLNNIYNVEDAFTTTADFVEGAGVSYPAGTNVAIINVGSAASPVYKYDAYTGTIDTSGFATKTEVNGLIVSATGTIDTSATSVTVAYTGTLIGFYATQNGQRVVTDVTISASGVTFTVAAAPTSAVTCTVVSAGSLS